VPDQGADLATRHAYDVVARDYAQMLPDMTAEAPLDRAVLSAFVEMLNGQPDGVVAELGCGSGRVTAHLADAGLHTIGLDLSPAMATVASSSRPDIFFAAADMGALPLRPGVLAGIVAWYSVINLPADALPQVFSEFARVMSPGAPVLMAFQCGEGERVDRTSAYGHPVPLTYHRHALDETAETLVEAGFRLHSTSRREPELAHETTPQGFLMAHRLGAA
jgi:ubiquinone/menaquinone biosynthesis C-methylase UbiE